MKYYMALRIVSVTFNTLFVILIYYLLHKLFKKRVISIFGTLFFAFSPLVFTRLFLCMYAGLFSAFISFVALMLLMLKIREYNRIKIRWVLLTATTIALLAYPSSFLNLIIFFSILLIALKLQIIRKSGKQRLTSVQVPEFRPTLWIILLSLICSFLIYYIYFVSPIFTELIPFMAEHTGNVNFDSAPEGTLTNYLITRLIFYISIPGLILVLPGLYLLTRQKIDYYWKKFLYSWLATWFLIYLFAAPGLLAFILRLGKEGLFILPLFSIFAGLTASFLWERGKKGKFGIIAIFVVYIAFSLYKWAMNIKTFMIFVE